jgi:Flp pilus assembly CpaE family ATPase
LTLPAREAVELCLEFSSESPLAAGLQVVELRMLETIILGASGGFTSQVQQMCSELQDICIYRSTDRYPQAHELIRMLNGYAPQLVFVDFEDEEAASAMEAVIRSSRPSAAVLAVCKHPQDDNLLLSGLRARTVLSLPCQIDEFRQAVYRALGERADEKIAPVFSFLPAKAGSGATTTALFVANILSKLAQKKVLLLECDLHAGPISMLFNVLPSHSIVDALEESDRLTDATWERMVISFDGVDVLSSVGSQGVRRVSPWAYQRLLAFARSRYDIVISDLPEVVNDATEVVVRLAKSVFVVTTPSMPSLHLAARRRHHLEMRGVGLAKVKFILNRKARGQGDERASGYYTKADEVAAIPVDESLVDASEFRLEAAKAETIAECTKIAEYCSGTVLAPRRSGSRFSIAGWLRGSSRSPELYSQAAAR